MATRVVEGKKPYTGGKAISINEDKVISLNLRDENNLIIYDEGDDEIYVDLQLPDGITPTDAFPVGVTTGRAVVADGWDKAGTIICAKTTSGDNIKLLYADDGTLWIDNGTGTFKQIYFKADVDALLLALRNYVDGELAKKQNGVSSDTAPSNPSEGDLWYDTTNSTMKVWDGTAWQSVGTGGGSDIEYVTQVEYDALPSSKLTDGKHYVIYTSDSPTPPSPGWQPGANTVLYVPMSTDLLDHGPNQFTLTNNGVTLVSSHADIDVGYFNGSAYLSGIYSNLFNFGNFHFGLWLKMSQISHDQFFLAGTSNGDMFIGYGNSNKLGIGRNGIAWDSSSSQSLTVGTRYYISFDRSSSSLSISVNATSIGTHTNSKTYVTLGGYQIGNDGTGNYINGYMSDIILEDKARTAQEISDYYNQTKGDYGIS